MDYLTNVKLTWTSADAISLVSINQISCNAVLLKYNPEWCQGPRELKFLKLLEEFDEKFQKENKSHSFSLLSKYLLYLK